MTQTPLERAVTAGLKAATDHDYNGITTRSVQVIVVAALAAYAATPLRVGDVLEGFCGGVFGDSCDDKRVEAIGADWVVARGTGYDTGPAFYAGDPDDLTAHRRRDGAG